LSTADKTLTPLPSVSRHPPVKLTREVAAANRLGDDWLFLFAAPPVCLVRDDLDCPLILEVIFFAEMTNTDESSSLLLYTEMLSCAVIAGTGKLDAS
jgi:hypothetical protein